VIYRIIFDEETDSYDLLLDVDENLKGDGGHLSFNFPTQVEAQRFKTTLAGVLSEQHPEKIVQTS